MDTSIRISTLRILKPHQENAVQFLLDRYLDATSSGCVLADVPGSGKTLTVLTFLSKIVKLNIFNKFLVLCPKSVVQHWLCESKKWSSVAETLSVYWIKKPSEIDQSLWTMTGGLALMSYGCWNQFAKLTMQRSHLGNLDVVICDEAHQLKNPRVRASMLLQTVDPRFAILLTGTPISNNIRELYYVMKFTDKKFMTKYEFCYKYACLLSNKNTSGILWSSDCASSSMFRNLHCFLSRNTDIHEKNELVVWLSMSEIQRKFYKLMLRLLFSPNNMQTRLFQSIMEISSVSDKLLCDISLLKDNPLGKLIGLPKNKSRAFYSIKINSVLDIITHNLKLNKKVAVFVTSLEVLRSIGEKCADRDFNFVTLEGKMSFKARSDNVNLFNGSNEINIILVSKKAGAEGICLASAETSIIVDVDWNPSIDYQCSFRAHRYGQSGPVTILRLVVRDSLDEHKLMMQYKKLELTLGHPANGVRQLSAFQFLRQCVLRKEYYDELQLVHESGIKVELVESYGIKLPEAIKSSSSGILHQEEIEHLATCFYGLRKVCTLFLRQVIYKLLNLLVDLSAYKYKVARAWLCQLRIIPVTVMS